MCRGRLERVSALTEYISFLTQTHTMIETHTHIISVLMCSDCTIHQQVQGTAWHWVTHNAGFHFSHSKALNDYNALYCQCTLLYCQCTACMPIILSVHCTIILLYCYFQYTVLHDTGERVFPCNTLLPFLLPIHSPNMQRSSSFPNACYSMQMSSSFWNAC